MTMMESPDDGKVTVFYVSFINPKGIVDHKIGPLATYEEADKVERGANIDLHPEWRTDIIEEREDP